MNKYSCILVLFLIICFIFFGFYKTASVNSELELIGKVIYIDAGHGGTDPGAMYGKIIEADINLSIASKLKESLISKGAVVYMTREYDNDLSYPNSTLRKRSDLINRAKMIDKTKSDMYISIHLNASPDSSWKGAQVFYDDVNIKNETLALVIQKQFKKDLKTTREIKEIKDLYMYKNTKTLGVLVEVGFLSNPNERYLLQTEKYQEKISKSLTNAIINYYKGL